MNTKTITAFQIDTLRTTLEGCFEELEELMREHDYYVTELTDRIADCMDILRDVQDGTTP